MAKNTLKKSLLLFVYAVNYISQRSKTGIGKNRYPSVTPATTLANWPRKLELAKKIAMGASLTKTSP